MCSDCDDCGRWWSRVVGDGEGRVGSGLGGGSGFAIQGPPFSEKMLGNLFFFPFFFGFDLMVRPSHPIVAQQ